MLCKNSNIFITVKLRSKNNKHLNKRSRKKKDIFINNFCYFSGSDSDTNVETSAISLNTSLRCESAPTQIRKFSSEVKNRFPRQKSHEIKTPNFHQVNKSSSYNIWKCLENFIQSLFLNILKISNYK